MAAPLSGSVPAASSLTLLEDRSLKLPLIEHRVLVDVQAGSC